MTDPVLTVTTWLKSSADLAALVGANIFAPVMPEEFSCMEGNNCVVVRRRGGTPHPEIPTILDPSFTIECWSMESPIASQIYGIVHDLIHGATSIDLGDAGFVILAQEEISGQDIIDPETHWATVVSYYHFKIRSSQVSPGVVTPVQFIGSDLPSKPFHRVAQSGVNAVLIKGGPGVVTSIFGFSPATAQYPVYIKLFDQTTAPDPAGDDIPVSTTGVEAGVQANPTLPDGGIEFLNGIYLLITKEMADNDDTPVVAGDVTVDIGYQ
jgi:hypothetical protein